MPVCKKVNSFNANDLYLHLNSKIKLTYFNFYLDVHGYNIFSMQNIVLDYLLDEFNLYLIRELINHKELNSTIAQYCYVLICNFLDKKITSGRIDWSNLEYKSYTSQIDDYISDKSVIDKFLEFNNIFV